MDGVLVNFSGRIAEEFGVEESTLDCWGIWDRIGITEKEFWDWLNKRPAKWWANLCPYPWAVELYKHCCTIAPVTFATSPTRSGSCLDGKAQWLEKMFGRDIWNHFQMGVQKHLMATPSRVLIDDADKNIAKFTKSGGLAITFPRLWNSKADYSDMALSHVCYMLGELKYLYAAKECAVAYSEREPLRAMATRIDLATGIGSVPRMTIECDLLNWN